MQTADFVCLVGLEMKHNFLDPKSFIHCSLFNDQMKHSIPVSHSKVGFCGVQKRKGKLVFSKSGALHGHFVLRSTRTKCCDCP